MRSFLPVEIHPLSSTYTLVYFRFWLPKWVSWSGFLTNAFPRTIYSVKTLKLHQFPVWLWFLRLEELIHKYPPCPSFQPLFLECVFHVRNSPPFYRTSKLFLTTLLMSSILLTAVLLLAEATDLSNRILSRGMAIVSINSVLPRILHSSQLVLQPVSSLDLQLQNNVWK